MRVLVLGAGQDVGKSCVVVRFGGRTFMFDCGMHLGYQDERRFPDFSLLSPSGDFSSVIDAIFITHFHLDHVGALPYFTEVCGYKGPIYMTYPTRAIAPLMLEDYHKVLVDRPGSGPLFAKRHIGDCMAKVTVIDLQEAVQVFEGCEVTAYNAGHVLGAAVLHVRVGGESVVYTGDFNTIPDRHLAGACVGRLRPDLLISESTYATSIRESKTARESSMMTAIQEAVSSGGKVLIPVFAVGRAQELLLLLDEFWERTQSQVPIYFSGPMASRANQYYRLLQNWASERVKQGGPGARSAAFGFSRVQQWQPELVHQPGACVLFATPGMLQGGTSLEVFKAWAPHSNNLVLLPSYQVAGTLGRKLMLGQRKGLLVDRTTIDVNCKVYYTSVSAHADAKGILQLVQQVAPAAVCLVHGEQDKMAFMSNKIQSSLDIKCFMPAIGEEVELNSQQGFVPVPTSAQLLRRLPLSLQQLQERYQQQEGLHVTGQQQQGSAIAADVGTKSFADGGGGGGSPHPSVAAAAAGWLQQGDVGQLVHAAMKLAGLNTGSPATADAAGRNSDAADQLQQQQLPVSAAAKAAQLAPWLELLAAAAQDVQQTAKQQAAVPEQQGLCEQQQEQGQQLAAEDLSGHIASLSRQLHQQLALEAHSTIIDGVLVVQHLPPQPGTPTTQPLVQSLQLLPAGEAAAVLGLKQHTVKLRCQVTLPVDCWQHQGHSGSGENSGLGFLASVLRAGLPAPLSQQVKQDSSCIQLLSLTLKHSDDGQGMVCSWLLHDDALAEQCLSLIQMA